jgi:Bacterial self-protective colicin-like immunity
MIADGAFVPESITKYKALISQFIEGQISASDFQEAYLTMFQNEEHIGIREVFDVLEYLFTSADGSGPRVAQ